MKQNDEAQGGSLLSSLGLNSDNAPNAAHLLEEALRSLEAIAGLMEKVQHIASHEGASDAAILDKLKTCASPGAEQKILDAVLELAAILQTGEPTNGAAGAETQTQSAGKSVGRFRDLI